MDRVLKIFTVIESAPNISQRKLCKEVGCSLGTINKILTKLVDENELYINQKDQNNYEYKITSKGKETKARLLHDYVLESFDIITGIKKKVKDSLTDLIDLGIDKFYLFGEKDDIYKIIKMTIMECKRNSEIEYEIIENLDEINKDEKYFLLTWHREAIVDDTNSINVLML